MIRYLRGKHGCSYLAVFAAMLLLRPLSWLLGLLDNVYLFLSIIRKKSKFFEAGYGDTNFEFRLKEHIGGALKRRVGPSVFRHSTRAHGAPFARPHEIHM
jgi:hypothetical protein